MSEEKFISLEDDYALKVLQIYNSGGGIVIFNEEEFMQQVGSNISPANFKMMEYFFSYIFLFLDINPLPFSIYFLIPFSFV